MYDIQEISYERCKKCRYKIRNTHSSSTPRDVIIACSIGYPINLEIFVRTLRHSGSKAKCIFLVDSYSYNFITDEIYDSVYECGGQIIPCGYISEMTKSEKQNYIYIICYEFIMANFDKIDRVIIADMYDTAFQGDPFNYQMEDDKLKIVDEYSNFTTEPGMTNKIWIHNFDPKLEIKDEEIYFCTGFIGGKVTIVYRFLTLFLEYMKMGDEFKDQGLFNYLYFSGKLRKYGIEVSPKRTDEFIRHTAGLQLGTFTKIGKVKTYDKKTYASVVHHYYLNPGFVDSIFSHCPNISYDNLFDIYPNE
ncbi:hypothetical protein TVAG_430500 [Trichomonas vaginalis G3]|uniref:Uncharacterized protein n=1 Tax=Trichomonas vaginalis (strain ATCC PRA-98 / G3) TaxID=412133 RepID=A2E376_TRIV3|nr:hypothetical protein TVAGG3_1018040 [Trichomonas vaginalis G3]EAY12886.1 hypothetical protein TVAG_430500 [Trichomonas vaginalis G3]KAI5491945.1 hypothetical protein TVAGG3_1018040 [Trichomonas vaginalis G3]|eukprot:XP_001325109.1 hypothetical protein [Trichomonas vaginalis G3]